MIHIFHKIQTPPRQDLLYFKGCSIGPYSCVSTRTHFVPLTPEFAHEQIHFDSACQSSHFGSACQSYPFLKSPEATAIRELSHLPLSGTSGVEHKPDGRNQSIELFGTPVPCCGLIGGATLKYGLHFPIPVNSHPH